MAGLTTQDKQALQKFKKGLLDTFGDRVVSIQLFGSKARGDANDTSDIDVLVILRDRTWQDRRQVIHLAVDATFGTGVLLSPKIFSPEEWDELKYNRSMFWQEVDPDLVRL